MRIVQLDLRDYNLVKDSGISKISATFTEDVQLFIGPNGSGKSSFMRQISPMPSVRSLFGKEGFKSTIIEKDGIYYRLESEYEKPSSPHAFYEGESEDNLNIGRTTETQKELIAEHLGITPLVDDLMMNRIDFPMWTPTKRKEFLMEHNPDDIGFVLQEAKKISSKIRACKNNIVHLQRRKLLLEQDLLSDEDIANLEAEKLKIENDLRFFQNELMNIDVGNRVLGNNPTSVREIELRVTKKILRDIRYRMGEFREVPRDDQVRRRLLDRLRGDLASCMHQLETLETKISKDTQDLTDLEVQYRDLAVEGDLKEIENTIARLELDRDRLKTTAPAFELSRAELASRYNALETLRENLLGFLDCRVPLHSSRKRALRERALSAARYKSSSYEMTLSDLRTKYEELTRRHSMSPADIPDAPCAKNACPLYAHFMEGYQDAEGQRQTVAARIAFLERRQKRNALFIQATSRYFEESRFYHDRIQWLLNEASGNPVLHGVLRSCDILTTLKTNANAITMRLKDAYDHIEQWWKYKGVLNDLETAYALKSRCMGSQSHDTVKLVVSIEALKKSLDGFREEIDSIAVKRSAIQSRIHRFEEYEKVKETVLGIQRHYQDYIKFLADRHERERLALLRNGIEGIRSQTFMRMSEVERTLRAQSGLKERYQEEVIVELTRIEKELADQLQIEKALIEIPKENTVDFLNGIFDQANIIIDSIWTIPFRIENVKLEDDLNYEFMVSGDNQTLREMSKCSAGQLEILTLAINIALRIELGHLNIPLCLDETGRTFDEKHKQHLVLLLKKLLEDKIISQLFYVSHHADTHESFSNSETLVLREENIALPQGGFNHHATIL